MFEEFKRHVREDSGNRQLSPKRPLLGLVYREFWKTDEGWLWIWSISIEL